MGPREQITLVNGRSNGEAGFALPSVMMLITILSLVSFSIIGYQYIHRRLAQIQIASMKAEYAAQSGVVKILADGTSSAVYSFSDGSSAIVRKSPWGLFPLVFSEGAASNCRSVRIALAAARPAREYDGAMLFANTLHQLVLTGSSSVKGDVVVGQSGIATGSIRNFPTPVRMPIEGSVTKLPTPELPGSEDLLRDFAESFYDSEFGQTKPRTGSATAAVRAAAGEDGKIDLTSVSDSIDVVTVPGNAALTGHLTRRMRPLDIMVDGNASVENGARFDGLVAVKAAGEISIKKGAVLTNALIVSRTSIRLMESAVVTGQFIAPSVTVDSNAVARYPSLVMSLPAAAKSTAKRREVVLLGNASVEGWVVLGSQKSNQGVEDIVMIWPRASIKGLLRSDALCSLDGSVTGMVHVRDFHFYQSPTRYYGWLRSAKIDRTGLPTGFLVPPVFSGKPEYEVLQWL